MTNDQFNRRVFLAGSLAVACGARSHGAFADDSTRGVARAVPVGGPPFEAALVAVAPDGPLRFRTAEGERRLAAADLVAWGAPAEHAGAAVHLIDGGWLAAAQVLEANQHSVKFDSDLFGEVDLPLALISAILPHPPSERYERDRLVLRIANDAMDLDESSSASPGAAKKDTRPRLGNRLLLVNGDELAGRLARLTTTKVEFDTDVGVIAPELDKVAAVLFRRARASTEGAQRLRIVTGFSDGSLVAADSLTLGDRQARVELAGAVKLSSAADAVVMLQPLGGRAVYLSDLRAESYRHVPFLDLAWPYRRDACAAGSRLRAGGRTYLKGIGMHSTSRLTYRIDGRPYKRFEADLAIDDRTAGRGSVMFRVFIDDRQAYKSDVIRGRDLPVPVSVDVSGGKRLSLIVDFAERGDELDHADWLDARFVTT
jgi:hypothetical protein